MDVLKLGFTLQTVTCQEALRSSIASSLLHLWSNIQVQHKMSVEKGLQSTDVAEIKAARAVAKGKVTKNIKSLNSDLVSDTNGQFQLEEIDDQIVEGIFEKLDNDHDTFLELHELYCYYREDSKDPSFDVNAKELEDFYYKEVSTEISSMKRKFTQYKKALKISIEAKQKEAEKS